MCNKSHCHLWHIVASAKFVQWHFNQFCDQYAFPINLGIVSNKTDV